MAFERTIIEETGIGITNETIRFIRKIEDEAYPEAMKLMQEAETVEDISYSFDAPVPEITIARGVDWYLIYVDRSNCIELSDIASSLMRDKEESRREMHDYLIGVINKKAQENRKPVVLNAKEDTSYKMIKRMVLADEYEIFSDTRGTWYYDPSIVMHDLVLIPKKTEVAKKVK